MVTTPLSFIDGVTSAERRTVASSVAGASEAAAWWTRRERKGRERGETRCAHTLFHRLPDVTVASPTGRAGM